MGEADGARAVLGGKGDMMLLHDGHRNTCREESKDEKISKRSNVFTLICVQLIWQCIVKGLVASVTREDLDNHPSP